MSPATYTPLPSRDSETQEPSPEHIHKLERDHRFSSSRICLLTSSWIIFIFFIWGLIAIWPPDSRSLPDLPLSTPVDMGEQATGGYSVG
jgi:hypothetical protein